MSKKIIVYSTFPPKKCGIGRYAAEQVLYLKRQGYKVYTMASDLDSSAHLRINLFKARSIIKNTLLILTSRIGGIYVHFNWEFFFPAIDHIKSKKRRAVLRILQYVFFLAIAVKSKKAGGLIFHETGPGNRHNRYVFWARAFVFWCYRNIYFHTQVEMDLIQSAFSKFFNLKTCHLVPHQRYMYPKFLGTKENARDLLKIPKEKTVFLCIGFIQAHKGFDEAIEAFVKADRRDDCSLYIVGSVRVKNTINSAYMLSLRSKISSHRAVQLVDLFVDDEAFDTWIVASDCVLLPYHFISSSGVAARSLLLKRAMIARGGTNLQSQLLDSKLCSYFTSTESFAQLIKEFRLASALDLDPAEKRTEENLPAQKGKRLLFIMPLFGKTMRGGAEESIYSLVENLSSRGFEIEVWATGSSHLLPRNNLWLGNPDDQNLQFKIRRFPTNRFSERLFILTHRRMCKPKRRSRLIEALWAYSSIDGRGMKHALQREHQRFDSIHVCHYFFGSTHRLSKIAPTKTIVHPFFHEEPQLYSRLMSDLSANSIAAFFNSEGEKTLATHGAFGGLPGSLFTVGLGVDKLTDPNINFPSDRQRTYELCFIGRLIPEKNLPLLIEWINKYNATRPIPVVLNIIGDGPLSSLRDLAPNPHLHFRGRISQEEKVQIIRNCLAVVQLSLLESFSLVMVEAWAEKTPVIVHKDCLATKLAVEACGGGFAVSDFGEFAQSLDSLVYEQKVAGLLGQAGFEFSLRTYTWEVVCQKFEVAWSKVLQRPYSVKPLDLAKLNNPRYFQIALADNIDTSRSTLNQLDGSIRVPAFRAYDQKFIQHMGSDFYEVFQDVFRGESQDPTATESWRKQAENVLERIPDPLWVDLGAGRGAFLDYLVSLGLSKQNLFGVELSFTGFSELVLKNYPSACMNAEYFLDRLEDETVDAVSLIHVVEHIPWQNVAVMIKLLKTRIRKGGFLFIEVPNIHSLVTSGIDFWLDPTHLRPLPFDLISFLLQRAGFINVERIETIDHPVDSVESEPQIEGSMHQVKRTVFGKRNLLIMAQS